MKKINIPPTDHVKVLGDQGWVGLIGSLGSEITILNAARVSFGKMKETMDDNDLVLLEYLISNRHTSPLEHVVFTFSVHCPLFVRGQWHRHRTWSYNEISRRYTEVDMEFYLPEKFRKQAPVNRQASVEWENYDFTEIRKEFDDQNKKSLELFNKLIEQGVCREQARSVLPQSMMVTFWATVDLNNLIHFLDLRDSEHAQWEIREYAIAIKKLISPIIPNVAKILKW